MRPTVVCIFIFFNTWFPSCSGRSRECFGAFWTSSMGGSAIKLWLLMAYASRHALWDTVLCLICSFVGFLGHLFEVLGHRLGCPYRYFYCTKHKNIDQDKFGVGLVSVPCPSLSIIRRPHKRYYFFNVFWIFDTDLLTFLYYSVNFVIIL